MSVMSYDWDDCSIKKCLLDNKDNEGKYKLYKLLKRKASLHNSKIMKISSNLYFCKIYENNFQLNDLFILNIEFNLKTN